MAKTAVVNLVDLAGSERVDSTGATGDRLKEVFKEKSQFMIMSLCLEHLFTSLNKLPKKCFHNLMEHWVL